MDYCCEEWKKQTEKELYDGKAEYISNSWTILGCCGHCCVMTDLTYCPFCGNKLLKEKLAGSLKDYAKTKPHHIKKEVRKGWREQILKAKEIEDKRK